MPPASCGSLESVVLVRRQPPFSVVFSEREKLERPPLLDGDLSSDTENKARFSTASDHPINSNFLL